MSHVFISYSKRNRDYARRLANRLLELGLDVWIDDRIDYGVDWWDAIDQAIQNCGAVVVIMTPEAKASRWVQREVSLAEDRGKPVFPLLLSGSNWSIFVRTQYVDVTNGDLPPPEYFDDLARYLPPRQVRGQEVTPAPESVKMKLVKRPSRRFWFAGAVVVMLLALVLAVVLSPQLQNQGGQQQATEGVTTLTVDNNPGIVYLQPVQNQLRVRQQPGDGAEISSVGVADRLESLEAATVTRSKIGQTGEWIQVRLFSGLTGYIAAQYVREYVVSETTPVSITGVNLDLNHPLGQPAVSRLGHLGWVRLIYNVSYNPSDKSFGNTDLEAAYNRYYPYLKACREAGYRIILVLNHQTYGEGRGFVWPSMDETAWQAFIPQYADFAAAIANQYEGKNLINVYQIWDAQDQEAGTAWAIGLPPTSYTALLNAVVPRIRQADPAALVISGGHTSGTTRGAAYARAVVQNLVQDAYLDGLAIHPYGTGVVQLDEKGFVVFGAIDEMVDAFDQIIPGAPVWITEWGVLDRPTAAPDDVARYAVDMIARLNTRYPGKVAAAVWYAWADGMANGYGLVDENDQPKSPLYELYLGT